jgi:hypothetical protein
MLKIFCLINLLICRFVWYVLQKWVQIETTERDPGLKNKIAEHKGLSKSSQINHTLTEIARIASPSTLKPNKIKYKNNKEKCKKQHEIISKEENIQVDLWKNPNWAKNLLVWQRLFAHHTLSSMRRYVNYKCCNAPQDRLDFVLDSTYRHEAEIFPEITDIYLQPETLGHETW